MILMAIAEKTSDNRGRAGGMPKAGSAPKMKPKYAAIAIAAVALVLLIAYLAAGLGNAASIVANGDNVSVYYTGSYTNGTVFNSNVGRQPFNFTVGANQVIPGFDQAVIGMRMDQNRTVTIPVNEAYGPINPALIISVPANAFGNQAIHVGTVVARTTPTGQQISGVITAINTTNVTVDFNSPLAGKVLVFNIEVVGIHKKQ